MPSVLKVTSGERAEPELFSVQLVRRIKTRLAASGFSTSAVGWVSTRLGRPRATPSSTCRDVDDPGEADYARLRPWVCREGKAV